MDPANALNALAIISVALSDKAPPWAGVPVLGNGGVGNCGDGAEFPRIFWTSFPTPAASKTLLFI